MNRQYISTFIYLLLGFIISIFINFILRKLGLGIDPIFLGAFLSLISLYAHNLSRLLPSSNEQEQASVIYKTAHGLNQTLIEIVQCLGLAIAQKVVLDRGGKL